MNRIWFRSNVLLIFLGVGLGLVARSALGPPESKTPYPRKFSEPLSVDLPSISAVDIERTGLSRYEHGPRAIFEPHGNQVCASGCALSRHPTQALTPSHFKELIDRYARGPMNDQNEALEELLYFGPQTRRQIAQSDRLDLDAARLEFLNRQLDVTHGTVAIRLVDSADRIRSWLPPTRVPLDRRHVFDMRTRDLPPLVTSGTIKRVGLNHVWSRL